MKNQKNIGKFKKELPISIRELLGHLNPGLYTRQTLVNLFRTFLENIIEDRLKAVVIMKIDNTDNIESVISRLNYSPSDVFVFNTDPKTFVSSDRFNFLEIDSPLIEKEEFLVVLAEKFSATIYWTKVTSELYGLYQGSWSFSPGDARYLADYLLCVSENPLLKELLEDLRSDRRYDERFTTIMTKLIGSLESRQRDLICANKELKELHEKALQNERLAAIGQVSSVIAHELRNPLGLIDLYAKILSSNTEKLLEPSSDKGKLTETIVSSANTIRVATQNLEKILSELLDYSKPLQLDRTSTDLKEMVDEVYNLVKPQFEEKKIDLELKYHLAKEVEISFDKLRMHQALLNLVKNAMEVSSEGKKVSINVDCRATDGTVYIKVQDQGNGIKEENLEKLFTPYFSTKQSGTGLGLALAKKVMKAHNGDIEILSTSLRGTTIALILPGEDDPLANIEVF